MGKLISLTVFLLVRLSDISAQTDTISIIQKQYNYCKYLWEEHSPDFQSSFPFGLEDFDNPALFKHYSRNSIAAYGSSKYLVPDIEIIEKSKDQFDPESRFLYQPGDSIIRFRPQEVLCLYRLDEVTDSIEQFANHIKALVISGSFHNYLEQQESKVRKVLSAFKNVTYLEFVDFENTGPGVVSPDKLMELILENRSFDQLEFLHIDYLTMEQILEIHTRYIKLKSLVVKNISNQNDLPLPHPFLNCPELKLLIMPLPSQFTNGNEFSHLRKLESLQLWGESIPFTDESLSPLTHLKQLCYTSSNDTVLFTNKNIEMLYLTIVSDDTPPTYIQIVSPSLRILSISRSGELNVRINSSKKIETLNIDAADNINLRLETKMKSLRELSFYTNELDFYSRYPLPNKLELNLKESMKIKYQNHSNILPEKETDNQF